MAFLMVKFGLVEANLYLGGGGGYGGGGYWSTCKPVNLFWSILSSILACDSLLEHFGNFYTFLISLPIANSKIKWRWKDSYWYEWFFIAGLISSKIHFQRYLLTTGFGHQDFVWSGNLHVESILTCFSPRLNLISIQLTSPFKSSTSRSLGLLFVKWQAQNQGRASQQERRGQLQILSTSTLRWKNPKHIYLEVEKILLFNWEPN